MRKTSEQTITQKRVRSVTAFPTTHSELSSEPDYDQLPIHEDRMLSLQHARQCGVLREGVARTLAKASRLRREMERGDAYIEPDQVTSLLSDLIGEATEARNAARKTRRGPMVCA